MTLLKIQLKVTYFPNALLWNSEQTPHTQLSQESTITACTASAGCSKIQNCVAVQALDKPYANTGSTQVITLSTPSEPPKILRSAHSVFMCFVWI